MSRYMKISKTLMAIPTKIKLISSVADFPVRISHMVTLESQPGLRASVAGYGAKWPESFARFDQDSSLWKTSQLSLFGGLAKFSETWPAWGMTRNGSAYRLAPLVPLTYELESGFLPTPVASEAGHRKTPYCQGGKPLGYVIGGQPSPVWTEWLMGFPTGWTDTAHSETQWSLKSSKSSGGR